KGEPAHDLKATRGGPLVAVISDHPDVATGEIQADGNTAKISAGKATGKAILLFKNGSGGIATVKVNVEEALLSISKSAVSVQEDDNKGDIISATTGDPIIKCAFDPPSVALAACEISDDRKQVTVKGKKRGTTMLTLTNAGGGSAKVTVIVQKKAPGEH